MALIQASRSVIPACDVPTLEKVRDLVAATWDLPGIGGYKIGLELVIRYGLPAVVRAINETIKVSDHDPEPPLIPVIYDHQKGGNDIPELGKKFAEAVAEAGVDAVILFPFAGPTTLTKWVLACANAGLHVLVGGAYDP